MKHFLLLFSFICFSKLTFGQLTETEVKNMINASAEKDLIAENSRFMQENFFHFANLVADKLLTFNKENANYNYRKGYILLEMNLNHELAITHLMKAVKKVSSNYDVYSPTEESASVDAFYHLGRALHIDMQYDKAIENYKKFLEKSTNQSELIAEANTRIIQCAVAKRLSANPIGAIPTLMGGGINTPFSDMNPQVSLEGQTLYFSSQRPWENKSSDAGKDVMFNTNPDDIYVSNKIKNWAWTSPTMSTLSLPLVAEELSNMSADERTVYIYSNSGNYLFSSEFKNNSYSQLIALKSPLTPKSKDKEIPWNTHYSISPDGKMIFFVSNAEGGRGKRDIYCVEKNNGTWGPAQNMGGMINTPNDEETPFVGLNNNVLYFASNDTSSMGGFDIFMSIRDENGMWSKAKNIGFPFNSPADDFYFTHTANGKEAYVSSNRKGGIGMYDIYSIDFSNNQVENIAFLDGRIINPKGALIPEGSYITLKCSNCNDNTEQLITPRVRDGVFVGKLEKCKEYELTYYYSNMTKNPYTNKFSTNCDEAYQVITKRVLIDDNNQKIIPFPKYHINGIATDKESGQAIANASIKLTIDGNTANVLTAANGNYASEILSDYLFESSINGQIVASADGYLAQSIDVKSDLLFDSIITVNFNLEATARGFLGPYIVNYQYNKSNLTDYSKNKLVDVIKIMNDNPNLKIEIASHTDSRGPAVYNLWLSEMRAKTAVAYIKSKIVNPDRIEAKGYGEEKLLNDCSDGNPCNDKLHLQNRRTEFIIIK
jgi:outer membrane protein OmpA-like peptidoglycan-associated protein/tetratricopeptide (TPR) repeat protein